MQFSRVLVIGESRAKWPVAAASLFAGGGKKVYFEGPDFSIRTDHLWLPCESKAFKATPHPLHPECLTMFSRGGVMCLAVLIGVFLIKAATSQDGLGAGYDPVFSLSSGGARPNTDRRRDNTEVSGKRVGGFEEWLQQVTAVSRKPNLLFNPPAGNNGCGRLVCRVWSFPLFRFLPPLKLSFPSPRLPTNRKETRSEGRRRRGRRRNPSTTRSQRFRMRCW
jgi:hypothetical protein